MNKHDFTEAELYAGEKERQAAIVWAAHPDSTDIVRHGIATRYYAEGESNCWKAGGLTLTFNTPENCLQVYKALTEKTTAYKHPYHINPTRFGSVRQHGVTKEEAICIGEYPKLLHIESIGKDTLARLNGALETLFGEKLPAKLMHMKKMEKNGRV